MESLLAAAYLAVITVFVNPANLPPGPEDPVFARVADENAIFHVSWPGAGEIDPASVNKTEQLLGDEEVRTFLGGIRRRLNPDQLAATFPGVDPQVPQIVRLVRVIMTHPVTAFINDVQVPVAAAKDGDVKDAEVDVEFVGVDVADDDAADDDAPAENEIAGALDWTLATASMGFIVNAEDEVAEVLTAAMGLAASSGEFGAGLEPLNGRADEDGQILIASQNNLKIYLGRKDTYLFVAVGDKALDAITDAINDRRKPPTWYDQMSAQLDIPRPTKRVYVNLERIRKLAMKAAPPEVQEYVRSLGLDHVRRFAAASGLDETAFTSRVYLELDGKSGKTLSIFPDKGLTRDDLAMIPADATFAIAGQLDFAKFFDQVSKMAEDAISMNQPGPAIVADDGVVQIEAVQIEAVQIEAAPTGVDPAEQRARGSATKTAWKDLYSSLGPTWRVYNSSGEGGLLVTGTTIILDVQDLERFEQAVNKLKVLMRAEGVGVHEFEFHGKVIRYAGGSQMIQNPGGPVVATNQIVVPIAWMIDDGRLFISVSPQILKAHIRRRATTKRLADTPEIDAILKREKTIVLSYVDSPAFYRLAYSGALTLVPMAGAWMDTVKVDYPIHEVPSLEAISPYLRPGVMSIRRVETGFVSESHRSLPYTGTLIWAQLGAGLLSGLGINF